MRSLPHMSRRTTRRTLLAGGAGVAAAAAVGVGLEVTGREKPVGLPLINDFYLGLNVSGLEDPIPEGPSEEMLDAYASYGVRRLRLPGRWDFFQPEVNGPLDEEYLDLYLATVRRAVERDMTVTLEPCHNYGKRLINGTEQGFGDGVLTSEMFADFWSRFVSATGDVEGVTAWEPMGEPSGLTGTPQQQSQAWADAANAAVVAIRATGDERPIKIDVSQPGSHTAWTTDNVALHTVTDPLDRLVFSHHMYMDRNNSGKYAYWSEEIEAGDTHGGHVPLTYDVGVKRLKPFVAWLRKHDLKGEIGESGVGWADAPGVTSSVGWQIAMETTLQYCQQVGLPVYAWGAGPHLIRPYELSLEPFEGLPAPQWQVLSRYLPLTTLPSATIDVPEPGSTELTVDPTPDPAATTDSATPTDPSSPTDPAGGAPGTTTDAPAPEGESSAPAPATSDAG